MINLNFVYQLTCWAREWHDVGSSLPRVTSLLHAVVTTTTTVNIITTTTITNIIGKKCKNVKFALEEAMKAQRESRDVDLLFL